MIVAVFAAWILGSYLVGAVPFGLLAGYMKGIDIRTRGSGNIGATNTIRILGKPIGLTVFLLDFLKGAGPTFLAIRWGSGHLPETADPLSLAFLCGAAAVLGHCFPVYLHFKGGKGVASTAGAALVLRWDAALAAFAVFFIVRAVTRYVSVSSMALGVAFPLTVIVFHPADAFEKYAWITAGGWIVAALIVLRHRSNILRIIRGEESKIGEPDPERLR